MTILATYTGPIIVRDRPTDGRTDRPHYSVCNNRPHLRSTAKWSNNETDSRKTSTSDLAVAFRNFTLYDECKKLL